uniref:protein phosphatase 1 regulatory subunit 12A isoform X11 n=1 Tax=Gasterosteus aculeatus aculeatus TaxID=481459 RepID=UPI001A99ED2D|nr:protein phosphatase 1 regulatory subunit 12A isoform X11 [Gasterosteus aculeatus aculeatus]
MAATDQSRSEAAKQRRQDQLQRWLGSETDQTGPEARGTASGSGTRRAKVRFAQGAVFMAACSAGDREEVTALLRQGADINHANIDGLTALHQACIDENAEMVQFLVESGSDVNRGDNEGWTPLHAAASCGFIQITKYLIEHGARVGAVNSEGELPLDVATEDAMERLLKGEIKKQAIDVDVARKEEERVMLRDARAVLAGGGTLTPHPNTKATALHVAAAKGYIEVLKVLLQCGVDVDSGDIDGWTPLHAGAHWGQEEVCSLLADNMCNMTAVNNVGQTPLDVADENLADALEELQKKQKALRSEKEKQTPVIEIGPQISMVPLRTRSSSYGKRLDDPPVTSANTGTSSAGISRLNSVSSQRLSQEQTEKKDRPAVTTSSNSQSTGEQEAKQRRKSYLTPVRDEEAEAQRKARSRHARQSRRSTQGVTLTDLQEAEKTMKTDSKAREKKKEEEEKEKEKEAKARKGEEGQGILCSQEVSWRSRIASLQKSDLLGLTQPAGTPRPPTSDRRAVEASAGESETERWARERKERRQARARRKAQRTGESDDNCPSGEEEVSGSGLDPQTNQHPSSRSLNDCTQGGVSDGKEFKKLFEDVSRENTQLQSQLQDTQRIISQTRLDLEQATQRQERFTDCSALLDLERKDRRMLERRMAELDEELKSVCKRKTYSTKACDRVRGSHSSSMSSSSSPNAHSWCTTQPHLLRLCIRGTLTCKHIPMSASHTSSMHIPRAHKPALALKLPLCVYFFCEHTHTSRIYHNHSFN